LKKHIDTHGKKFLVDDIMVLSN